MSVYLAGGVARLLYELSDAADVLRDVWHQYGLILQFIQLLHEQRNRLTQCVHFRERKHLVWVAPTRIPF